LRKSYFFEFEACEEALRRKHPWDFEGYMELPLSKELVGAGTETLTKLLLFSKTFPAENEDFDGLFFWSMDFLEDRYSRS